jgi:hypothetical protein
MWRVSRIPRGVISASKFHAAVSLSPRGRSICASISLRESPTACTRGRSSLPSKWPPTTTPIGSSTRASV